MQNPLTIEEAQLQERTSASLEDVLQNIVKTERLRIHTACPGIIAAFDPTKQTASVQPVIQQLFVDKGYVNVPLCVDVPVCFPGGGGIWFTFPVAIGDECLLIFAEKCIDRWFAYGGVQPPDEFRLHDYSDGFAIVGVTSQPNKLPPVSLTSAQIVTKTAVIADFSAGSVTITGNLHVTGAITGDAGVASGSISLTGHAHTSGTLAVPSSHELIAGVTGTPL